MSGPYHIHTTHSIHMGGGGGGGGVREGGSEDIRYVYTCTSYEGQCVCMHRHT